MTLIPPVDVQRTIDVGDRGLVLVVQDAESLARHAAAMAFDIITDSIADRSSAFVALSGGSTPRRMGELFANPPFSEHPFWRNTRVFWGDERWVPLDHEESNAGVAKRVFLDSVAIPANQIHPMPVHLDSADLAAEQYAREISRIVPKDSGLPRFDLIFLGMGDDGHTASLFPHTAALRDQERLVVANVVPQLDTVRLTLTAQAINAARDVVFLIAGESKAERLAKVLEGSVDIDTLPSQLVRPLRGQLTWVVDEAAASRLTGQART
ncbi:6-phosphogluconolactonase [soil metagenome]